MGAVLIEGCKWCGKSTNGSYHAKSIIILNGVNCTNYSYRYEDGVYVVSIGTLKN